MNALRLCFAALLVAAAFSSGAAELRADTVTLKNGSVVNGTITGIAGGVITVDTDFAGTLKIRQSEVASFSTRAPVSLKAAEVGTVIGTVAGLPGGQLAVATAGGTVTTTVGAVKSSWGAGAEDPEAAALRPKWNYQVALDISGKSGNSTNLASGLSGTATRRGPEDRLKFFANFAYTRDNDLTSADAWRAGVDYNSFFGPRISWFVGTSVGRDRIKLEQFNWVGQGGFGYNAIRAANQELQFRGGASYRYTTYDTGFALLDNQLKVNSAGLFLALAHRLVVPKWGVMNNSLTYTPTFEDFGNYLINHDSNFTMPLGGSGFWALRVGLANDYTSQVARGTRKLDTTYYLRLVFTWL